MQGKLVLSLMPQILPELKKLKSLVGSLQSQGVACICYRLCECKKDFEDVNLLRSGFNFFSLDNLTWFYKPVIPFIEDFLNRKFDILFDLGP